MKTKICDLICAGGTVTAIATLETVSLVLSAIASAIAITTGIISIILKIKKATADGVITPEEKAEILNDVNDVREDIEKMRKEGKQNV